MVERKMANETAAKMASLLEHHIFTVYTLMIQITEEHLETT